MPHKNPQVKFIRDGKTGFVSYIDKEVEISFKLNVEYGIEECVAMIKVPGERDWEHLTQLTLKEKTRPTAKIQHPVICGKLNERPDLL